MKNTLFIKISALVLALAMALSACQTAGSPSVSPVASQAQASTAPAQETPVPEPEKKDPVTITVGTWQVSDDANNAWWKGSVVDFTAKFGDSIIVEIQEFPVDGGQWSDKVKVQMSTNQLPDVLMNMGGTPMFDLNGVESGAIVNLSPYLDKDPEFMAIIDPRAWIRNTYKDGNIYAIPCNKECMEYFYNKDIFQKVGVTPATTWDEFWAVGDKIQAAGYTYLAIPTDHWTEMQLFYALLAATGPEGLDFCNDPKHQKDWNKPYVIETLRKMQSIFQKYTSKDMLSLADSWALGQSAFATEKAAIWFNGPWAFASFSDINVFPEGFDKKVGQALYPGDAMYTTFSGGNYLCAKTPEKADAGYKFLTYIAGLEQQTKMLEMGYNIPNALDVTPSAEFQQKQPLMYEFFELSKKAKVLIAMNSEYLNQSDALPGLLVELANSKMTAEEVAQRLTDLGAANAN